MSATLSQLLEKRSQIDAEIAMLTGGAAVGTSLKGEKKDRKPSKNKGVPTAYGAFSSKVQAEHKDEIAAFKAANPDKKRGAHFEWVGNYKKTHEEEYKAFEATFKVEHPKEEHPKDSASDADASETSSEKKRRGPKKLDDMTPEEKLAHTAKVAERKAVRDALTPEQKAAKKAVAAAKKAAKDAVPVADAAPAANAADAVPAAVPAAVAPVAKPKKAGKKATKAEPVVPVAVAPAFSAATVAVPAEEDDAPELLPFKHAGVTYMRLGTKREGGNLWATSDLWANKKGVKGAYVGSLKEDGSVDTDADEPTLE